MPIRFLSAHKRSFKTIGAVAIAAILLFPVCAHAGFRPAGFEWVAPGQNQAAPSYGAQPSTPVEIPSSNQAPEIISPVVIEGQTSSAPMPPPSPYMEASPSQPVMPSLQPSVASSMADQIPVPAAAPAPEVSGQPLGSMLAPEPDISAPPVAAAPEEIVHGFANNVPLAVALRQILPPGYGFSIDQDVDLGTLVSFQGGKPWRETLANTLQPAGLMMHEQDQMVSIGHAGMIAGAAPMPAEAAPMPPEGVPSTMLPPEPTMAPSPMEQPGLAVPVTATETWSAGRNATLHKVLESWAHRAGVEFNWLAEYDYPLQASVSFTGTFEEAVRALLAGFQNANPQPIAELHNNPNAGQKVLVVQTRGNSYSD